MSTPASESDLRTKIRSIEVALDNFKNRMQASFSSHLSTVTTKVERVKSKIPLSNMGSPSPQPSEVELHRILEEIKGVIQKDVVDDTVRLLNDKLSEFHGLVSRVESLLSTLGSSSQQQPAARQHAPSRTPLDANKQTLDEKDKEIASLREEINRLYNLTEREPRFQAFWVLRDAYPNWVQIVKIARTLNADPTQVHEDLRIFEEIGVVEIKAGDARAVKLVRPTKPNLDTRST
jgi:hypothetical protein